LLTESSNSRCRGKFAKNEGPIKVPPEYMNIPSSPDVKEQEEKSTVPSTASGYVTVEYYGLGDLILKDIKASEKDEKEQKKHAVEAQVGKHSNETSAPKSISESKVSKISECAENEIIRIKSCNCRQ
uniref:PALM2 n=1 Tax=Haemonchus placei TaxID=6290 RepID=A0A158QPR5_HAEPC